MCCMDAEQTQPAEERAEQMTGLAVVQHNHQTVRSDETSPSRTPSRCTLGHAGYDVRDEHLGTTRSAVTDDDDETHGGDDGDEEVDWGGVTQRLGSERSTSAMTSSITAAAMMSCPVGVERPPSCNTLRLMPIDVGAKTRQPLARI